MQKIYVKKLVSEDNIVKYIVPAISLKNSENAVKITIPHPMGSTTMEFSTIEEAVSALENSGFEYVLPEGEAVVKKSVERIARKSDSNPIERILFKKMAVLASNFNNNLASSAIQGLSNLGCEDAVDIFLDKIGEDNEAVRTSAINGLVKHSFLVVDKLISALEDENWVKRNSAITCLSLISDNIDIEPEKLIVPIIKRIDDENPIVQANAILVSSKIYKNFYKSMNEK